MKKNSRFLRHVSRHNIQLFSLALGGALAVGCGNTPNGGSFSSDSSSTAADQTAGLAVTASFSAGASSYMHVFGAFASPCTIQPGTTKQDIKCMVNVRETDAYSSRLTLSLNVPAGMCAYIEKSPYFYYNYQPGYGSGGYQLTVTDGAITSCSIDGVASSHSATSCTGPFGTISSGGTVACKFNYSGSSSSGPNCCLGTYNTSITTVTNTTSAGVTTTTSTTAATTGDYGGALGSCIAGPGQSQQWKGHTAIGPYAGFPFSILEVVPSAGLAETLPNHAPIDYLSGSPDTLSISNFYFDWTAYQAQGNGVTATLPKAIDPTSLAGSAYLPKTNDSWQFLCEDEAHEILHRIRVYVNEWDTNEQYALYMSSAGAQGNPVAPEAARDGIDCNIAGSISYGYCNDFYSLRDYVSGSYGSARSPAYSIGYFPMDPITDADASTN